MVSLVVLADLANVSVYRRLYRPNPPILRQRLRSFLHKLVDRLRSSSAQLAEFRIRLYDGWFDEQGNGTELHGMLKRIVYEDYPTRFRRARVFVELAIAPAAYPRLLLRGTCRVVPGISPDDTSPFLSVSSLPLENSPDFTFSPRSSTLYNGSEDLFASESSHTG